MFQMPNSVSVNTMCFLFHAGVGTVIVRHFLHTGPDVSRALREVACEEPSFLRATNMWFGVKGPTSPVGRITPQPGQGPQGWRALTQVAV